MKAELNHTLVIAQPTGILKLFNSYPVVTLIAPDSAENLYLANGNLLEVDCRVAGETRARTYFIEDVNVRRVFGAGEVNFNDRSHYCTTVNVTVVRDTEENLEARISNIKNGVRI